MNLPTTLTPTGQPPKRQHPQDAGLDCYADATVTIPIGQRRLVPLGFCAAIPAGHVGLLTPRSSLAMHHGITLINSPGTIDAGYRGEYMAALINHGTTPYRINKGDRIAQLIVLPIELVTPTIVDQLPGTDTRGTDGFGSTGKN